MANWGELLRPRNLVIVGGAGALGVTGFLAWRSSASQEPPTKVPLQAATPTLDGIGGGGVDLTPTPELEAILGANSQLMVHTPGAPPCRDFNNEITVEPGGTFPITTRREENGGYVIVWCVGGPEIGVIDFDPQGTPEFSAIVTHP